MRSITKTPTRRLPQVLSTEKGNTVECIYIIYVDLHLNVTIAATGRMQAAGLAILILQAEGVAEVIDASQGHQVYGSLCQDVPLKCG